MHTSAVTGPGRDGRRGERARARHRAGNLAVVFRRQELRVTVTNVHGQYNLAQPRLVSPGPAPTVPTGRQAGLHRGGGAGTARQRRPGQDEGGSLASTDGGSLARTDDVQDGQGPARTEEQRLGQRPDAGRVASADGGRVASRPKRADQPGPRAAAWPGPRAAASPRRCGRVRQDRHAQVAEHRDRTCAGWTPGRAPATAASPAGSAEGTPPAPPATAVRGVNAGWSGPRPRRDWPEPAPGG